MKVALTGSTGFVGSHILAELGQHGHEVTALVRSNAQAAVVAAAGATPAVVDLYDQPGVLGMFRGADGASPSGYRTGGSTLTCWPRSQTTS